MTSPSTPDGRGATRSDAVLPTRRARQAPADRIADLLTATVLPVAQRAERAVSTSATPEQVDVVIELEALGRELVEHNRRVLQGLATDWARIAERLAEATARARGVVVIDPVDTEDAADR